MHHVINKIIAKSSHLDWLQQGTVLLMRHGSMAYGTNIPTSDEDFKGVAIPPKQYYFGNLHHFEQAELKAPDPDSVIYDLRKFFKLASDNNPNIIEVLFVSPEDRILVSPLGQRILDHRDKFLSKRVHFTFGGYAHSQLKRIKLHHGYLLNPPSHFPRDKYQEWKKNRNPIRAAMEEKFGYDCKHGLHQIRLLRIRNEILATGQVMVKRPDREELLAIRRGDWTYEQLIQESERLEARAAELYETSNVLPKKPDLEFLDRLCMELVETFLERGNGSITHD
jgi:uncharacterized protein